VKADSLSLVNMPLIVQPRDANLENLKKVMAFGWKRRSHLAETISPIGFALDVEIDRTIGVTVKNRNLGVTKQRPRVNAKTIRRGW
jgi:hypothetical protein